MISTYNVQEVHMSYSVIKKSIQQDARKIQNPSKTVNYPEISLVPIDS